MRKLYYISFCMFSCLSLKASNILSVKPLTDKIVLVHFDDGYIRHHVRGEQRTNEWAVASPLNEANASDKNNYNISSSNDNNYTSAKVPSDLGRKTKGTDFSWICNGWGTNTFFNVTGCLNTNDVDATKEHWVYLFLPTAMLNGKTYTVNTGTLAANGSVWSFTFNEKDLRSEAVHVNMIGYSTSAQLKCGYVYHWMGNKGGLDLGNYNNTNFYLIDTLSKAIVFTGQLTSRKSKTTIETGQNNVNETPLQNFSGSDVYECDFSSFNTSGNYVLSVDKIGCSFPFTISCDVYREPFKAVMKGIYQQRSGIALTAAYTKDPRPAPHNPNLTQGFKGNLKYTSTRYCDVSSADADASDKAMWEAGVKGDINVWGWYQDAGDWDGYLSHSRVPTTLLFLYENYMDKFTDNELNIPESGNGVPDVLDEARWLIRCYKRIKDSIQVKGWGTGGVGGSRIMGDLWGGDTRADGTTQGSWEDTARTWVVSGEDPFITYKYAGLAAHYAWCLQLAGKTDPESVNWQQEAINAYNWATTNSNGNSSCHSFSLRQMRMYAAASLYKLTGTVSYNTQYISDFNAESIGSTTELTNEQAYGVWTYSTMPGTRTTNATVLSNGKAAIQGTADEYLVNHIDQRACRWGGHYWMPMLVGQSTTPLVFEGVIAYAILKNSNPVKADEYLKGLFTTSDYFLGNNPLNTTWITGLGERFPEEIFHMDSWYSGTGKVRDGVIPYGPWLRDPNINNVGPWSNQWPEKTVYPSINNWPGHERWFDQRTSPLSAEFTIWQTNAIAVGVFGALLGNEPCQLSTSIDKDEPTKISSNNIVHLYPNPSSDGRFTIATDGPELIDKIEVYNSLGQLIYSVCTHKKQIETVELSDVTGLLFFKITTNASVKIIKVVR